jgi:hypothetical protein
MEGKKKKEKKKKRKTTDEDYVVKRINTEVAKQPCVRARRVLS